VFRTKQSVFKLTCNYNQFSTIKMRKLSEAIENNVVSLTENGVTSRAISKRLGISQSAVIAVQKRRSVTPKAQVAGRKNY